MTSAGRLVYLKQAQQSAVNSKCQQMTGETDIGGKVVETLGNVTDLHLLASVGSTLTNYEMRHLGAEHTPESPVKQANPETGAVKSAALSANSQKTDKPGDFAAAVQAIMSLPLSDDEKAEAIRRLLKGGAK